MANRLQIPLPDRCLLYQALLWVAEEFVPIDDRIFMSLPELSWGTVEEKHRRDLLIALKSGSIPAQGVLWVVDGPRIGMEDQNAEIKPEIWEWKRIEWENSTLWVNTTWPERVRDGRWQLHQFEAITVPTAALLATFPAEKKSIPFALEPPSAPGARRRGRPRDYDWDGFYVEVAVRADLDSLPEKQAELERAMADWCSQNWENVPTESMIREKLRPVYSHRRKAKK